VDVTEIQRNFPNIRIDVREAFEKYWHIEDFEERCLDALVTDVKQPFEKQPKNAAGESALYDGFVLQRIHCSHLPESEASDVHLIVTDKLTCTFDEYDWRYHARSVICGTPSLVSTSGIVEGPAKPKEYYLLSGPWLTDHESLKKQFAGRFIDYGDVRLDLAVTLYVYQAIFFFISDGSPFCDDKTCRLYNSHWQEELISNLSNPGFCLNHQQLLNKFNERNGC
jgi:hypothetical protein